MPARSQPLKPCRSVAAAHIRTPAGIGPDIVVRQFSMALTIFNWPRLRWPALTERHAMAAICFSKGRLKRLVAGVSGYI